MTKVFHGAKRAVGPPLCGTHDWQGTIQHTALKP